MTRNPIKLEFQVSVSLYYGDGHPSKGRDHSSPQPAKGPLL